MTKQLGHSSPMTPRPRSVAERADQGRRARSLTSRGAHRRWIPAPDRADPVTVLERQARTRVADLVPIRHGRMVASAFAFYRGAAAVMAADLASQPQSGLTVQLCGDAHLMNFGGFASPERSFVFDINDFDETHPGPFEWDIKRLAASLEVAGRGRGFPTEQREAIVTTTVASYRNAMHDFAAMSNLDIWYSRLDIDAVARRWGPEAGARMVKAFRRMVVRAESKDRLKAQAKLTRLTNGERHFVSDPPLLVPAANLFSPTDRQELEATLVEALRLYRRTLSGDRRRLLERYRFVELARKVVGVGSVGTRCWVALLAGRDDEDPLLLQIKEAEASVLEPFTETSHFSNHGQRVVEGQRLM